jgi:O-antigen ligase
VDKRTARYGQLALASLLVVLLLSQTRMAILATPIALTVWLALGQRRRNITAVLAVTALVAVATFGVSTLRTQGEILQQALAYRGQTASSNPAENSIAARSAIYQTGWNAFQDKPLVGFGFRLPTEYSQSQVFKPYGQPYAFEAYVVALPVEAGAIGALLFISFGGALILAAFRRLPDRADRATVVAAIVGSAVLAIGANPFDVPVSYFWLLMGLTFGLGLPSPPRDGETEDEDSARKDPELPHSPRRRGSVAQPV